MNRKYEIVYIFDSALEETEVTEHLDRFHELLKSPEQPEPVTGLAYWGKRTLAYPIKKKEVGSYVVAHVETDTTLLNEFERVIKLNEAVLRYLVVINEGLPAARIDQIDPETPAADVAGSGDLVAVEASAEAPLVGETPTPTTDETPEAEAEAEEKPAASTDEGGE